MADRFLNFLDLVDGGGMGASGDEFKGGGLLSDIANALFQPAGYRDRMRGRQEVRPMARPAGMMPPAPVQPPMPTGPAGAGGAMAGPGMPGFQPPMQPPMGPAGAGGPMAGPGMPGGPVQPMPISFEQFVAGLGPVAQTASPMALRQAYDQFLMGY